MNPAGILLLGMASLACAQTREMPNPAAAASGQPYLATSPDGKVYLSWIEPAAAGQNRMRFAVLGDAAWRVLGTVSTGANWFVNWADYPTLLPMPDGSFAAHWLEKQGSSGHSYGLKLARSAASGEAPWKMLFAPRVQQEGQYTGFVSLVALANELGAAYLGPAPGGGEHDKTLRFARFAPHGAMLSDDVVDADVCTCCQTSIAMTQNGLIVAYRDHEAGEIRDISVVAYKDGKWSHPRNVHRDGWRINGCPVNGPAVAAAGNHVAVAWYTAAQEKQRIYCAFSKDGGATFLKPVLVDDAMPLGRVALVLLPDDGAVVSWIGRKEILIRRVWADGRAGATQTVSAVDTARRTGFPKIALQGRQLILSWTDERVRTVAVPLPQM